MQDNGAAPAPPSQMSEEPASASKAEDGVVSTHVLVSASQAQRLRELSRRTRVAQSEYLREAVDNLLDKYFRLRKGEEKPHE